MGLLERCCRVKRTLCGWWEVRQVRESEMGQLARSVAATACVGRGEAVVVVRELLRGESRRMHGL